MKRAYFAILIALIAVVAIPRMAHAVCFVNDFGILFQDTDCDGIIDYDDMTDADFDLIPDGNPVDNCVNVKNGDCDGDPLDCDVNEDSVVTSEEIAAGDQIDWDGNDVGDACDDYDYDGIVDYLDNCRSVYDPTNDPTLCTDTDGDRFEDPIDNCPENYNTDQLDTDGDGVGDWCDNCRIIYNPAQNELDCPDDGSNPGGSSPQYSTNPPEPSDGINYDVGTGTIKGNGYGNNCSLAAHASAMPGASIAIMLCALAIALRRK